MTWDTVTIAGVLLFVSIRCLILHKRCKEQDAQINLMAEFIALQNRKAWNVFEDQHEAAS